MKLLYKDSYRLQYITREPNLSKTFKDKQNTTGYVDPLASALVTDCACSEKISHNRPLNNGQKNRKYTLLFIKKIGISSNPDRYYMNLCFNLK